MQNTPIKYIINLLNKLRPHPMIIYPPDYWLSPLGAALGLIGTAYLSHFFLSDFNPWFIAPMGASAVLLFGVPASTLAQPWSVIGGNLIAAVVGITCAKLIAPHSSGCACCQSRYCAHDAPALLASSQWRGSTDRDFRWSASIRAWLPICMVACADQFIAISDAGDYF